MIRFANAKILREGAFKQEDLWVSEGRVSRPGDRALQTVDLEGCFIAPGFVDLQVNGAAGIDLTEEPEKVDAVARALLRYGVTSFLATVVSSSPEAYRTILPILAGKVGKTDGAQLLGIHLEGPCFSPEQANAHDGRVIVPCSAFSSPEDCYGSLDGVKLVTLAPESPGAMEWIRWLTQRGIKVSIGHSRATPAVFKEAIRAGASMATHLFNAMPPFHHRAPGLAGAVLTSEGFPFTLIADGVHVDPVVVALAWKAAPSGLMLASDAMAALGMPDGCYMLGRQKVVVKGGVARIEGSDTLAGSVCGLDGCVRNLIAFSGATAEEALMAASTAPARSIGMFPKKGSLEPGADADFVVLDSTFQVLNVFR